MDIVTMTPRPAPAPDWTGVTLATTRSSLSQVGVYSTGAIGRGEGYDLQADALRAAHNLSRGADQDAAAVIGYEGRWYVQGVRAYDAILRRWEAPLRFEAAFPALVGPFLLRENTTLHRSLDGLAAIVDGARELRLA